MIWEIQGERRAVFLLFSFSCILLLVTPWTAAHQASLSFPISLSLLRLMSIDSGMPSNHLIFLCPCLKSFPASGSFLMSGLFVSGGQSIGASFNFSISLSKKYSGLISFRIDWFDVLAVQGTLKSLFQHRSSKASTLQHAFFFDEFLKIL